MAIVAEARETFAVAPEALWPLLADTDRLNRAIGLPPVRFRPVEVEGKPVLEGEFRWRGLALARWIEHPLEWEAPRHYSVRRDYLSGLLRRLDCGVELIPRQSGTEVRVWAEIVPRNWLGDVLARWIIAPRSTRGVLAQCRAFASYLSGDAAAPLPQLAGTGQAAGGRLEVLADRLVRAGRDRGLVNRLCQHVQAAPETDVSGMRPFELADQWGEDRRSVLALCLHATSIGLLDLSWHVLCPNCRVTKAEYTTLRSLQEQAHCDTCQMRYDVDFDHLVEVRFCVAPSIREVAHDVYCIGGPLNSPHVLGQTTLAPGAANALRLTLQPGGYRLRALAGPSAELRVVTEGAQAPRFALTAGGLAPAFAELSPGDTELVVENGGGTEAVVMLETAAWQDTAATGAIVGTVPEFRNLFSAEVLAPGLEVRIQRLGFLFTDLAGSTALYERVGDARAFRLVQEHFAILAEVVEAHRGAIVKTVGDAIMAVFPTAADAVEAAVLIQREIRRLDARGAVDPARLVRVGVHEGPCVAVTLNGRLDYFGTTVNTAARIEHESHGGGVTVSADAYRDPDAARRLAALPVRVEPFVTQLRGLSDATQLYRILPLWDGDATAPAALAASEGLAAN